MKKLLSLLIILMIHFDSNSQNVDFIEYDLDNGLHVILHQDNTAPVVITSVMYDVGGKDREEGRTGFAHFFEHLLFEGSKNIYNAHLQNIATNIKNKFYSLEDVERIDSELASELEEFLDD